MPNPFLDAKGLNCPLPILRAKKAIQALDIDGLLDIHATDPGAVKDFAAFCRSTGNELVSSVHDGSVYKFTIKRVNQDAAVDWAYPPFTLGPAAAALHAMPV